MVWCWLFGHDFRIKDVKIKERITVTTTSPSIWCKNCGTISEERIRILSKLRGKK